MFCGTSTYYFSDFVCFRSIKIFLPETLLEQQVNGDLGKV